MIFPILSLLEISCLLKNILGSNKRQLCINMMRIKRRATRDTQPPSFKPVFWEQTEDLVVLLHKTRRTLHDLSLKGGRTCYKLLDNEARVGRQE